MKKVFIETMSLLGSLIPIALLAQIDLLSPHAALMGVISGAYLKSYVQKLIEKQLEGR